MRLVLYVLVKYKTMITKKITIILGVIGADCHSVGNKILDMFFTEEGFNVVNLGVMISQKEFIDAAIETNADAILVSSLYGHAEMDCVGFKAQCIERGINTTILYIGGNLVVGKSLFSDVEKKFRNMGFDRVFSINADLQEVVQLLKSDVETKRVASIHHVATNVTISGVGEG